MLLKWIGAVLIFAGCGSCGFAVARNFRREERILHQLKRMLDTMINELNCRRSSLPQLFRVAAGLGGELSPLAKSMAQELEQQIAPDAASCMAVVLGKQRLPDRVKELLYILGGSLGSYDLEGQLRELGSVSARCSRILDEIADSRDERIRTYQTLGLCAGAAIAILLI